MVAIDSLWSKRSVISGQSKRVQARMEEALGDPEKLIVLTGQGNTAKTVKQRIELMRQILNPV